MKVIKENSLVMMVDIQEKLFPHIHNHEELLKNMNILVDGLKLFNLPFIVNEQYPKGLGSTLKELQDKVSEFTAQEKLTFSCCKQDLTKQKLLKSKKNTAIVFGIETHICVMQTCLDLLANNISPVLVVDCCGSRKQKDHDIAIMRMTQAGVIPITYEALLFEICQASGSSLFKSISNLIK